MSRKTWIDILTKVLEKYLQMQLLLRISQEIIISLILSKVKDYLVATNMFYCKYSVKSHSVCFCLVNLDSCIPLFELHPIWRLNVRFLRSNLIPVCAQDGTTRLVLIKNSKLEDMKFIQFLPMVYVLFFFSLTLFSAYGVCLSSGPNERLIVNPRSVAPRLVQNPPSHSSQG